MKTKAIILIAISAIVTLSFTFASVTKTSESKKTSTHQNNDVPVGGLASEDKF